jgi:lipopolysaccharide transport system permease protein
VPDDCLSGTPSIVAVSSTSHDTRTAIRTGTQRRSRLRRLPGVPTATTLIANRRLIRQLAQRDLAARYKGSFLGLFWAVITPLVMLSIYAFVFTVVFKAQWSPGASKTDYAFNIFAGMIVFNAFAEVMQRAPILVTSNASYVKKVVFPLEVLPVVTLYVALVQVGISLGVLLVGWLIVHQSLSSTIWLFPLALLPLCMLGLGVSWFLAALGVFIRDVTHPVLILVQALSLLSGVFYNVANLSVKLQAVLKLNPLVVIIEDTRRTLLLSQYPHWTGWLAVTGLSFVVMLLGFWWFMQTRKAFADVL